MVTPGSRSLSRAAVASPPSAAVGLWDLPTYAVLLVVGTWSAQPDQVADPEGWATYVASTSYLVTHVLSNVSVQFSDDHRFARVESYCLSMQLVDPSSGDPFAGTGDAPVFTNVMSRYVDTFEDRVDGGWRILRRDCVFD